MRIIAIDTALGACSVAALDGETLCGHRFLDMNRGHAEVLMGLIDEVEAQAGFGVLACDRLAVTVGPGTFTGLRVGLAAARGFALASKKPLVGLTTLHAIAAGAEVAAHHRTIAVVLDARRGDVYLGFFKADAVATPLGAPVVLRLAEAYAAIRAKAEAAALCLIGTGIDLVTADAGELKPEAPIIDRVSGLVQPDAVHIARLAAGVEDVAAWPAEPLYLRSPDAKLPSRNPLT